MMIQWRSSESYAARKCEIMKHIPIRPMMLRALSVIICSACIAGCVKHQTTLGPPPAQLNPQPKIASDVGVRVQTLGGLADTYARLSNQLPGPSVAAHRKLMSEVFARLEAILPMLVGPSPGAEFRQQLQVIGDAQSELATGPADLSPEPTIDAGLRSARDALVAIARASYYERAELTPRFDAFSAKIDDLDTVRGPLHQVYVGDAVALSSQIITTMSHVLTQRLAEQNSTSQPTSRPIGVISTTNKAKTPEH